MPREAASSLPALGRGGGVGLLAREKSGRAAATVRKRNAPLAPLARPGGQGGHFRTVVAVRTDSRRGAVRGRRATKRIARLARRTQAARLDRANSGAQMVFRAVARVAPPGQGGMGLATPRSGFSGHWRASRSPGKGGHSLVTPRSGAPLPSRLRRARPRGAQRGTVRPARRRCPQGAGPKAGGRRRSRQGRVGEAQPLGGHARRSRAMDWPPWGPAFGVSLRAGRTNSTSCRLIRGNSLKT